MERVSNEEFRGIVRSSGSTTTSLQRRERESYLEWILKQLAALATILGQPLTAEVQAEMARELARLPQKRVEYAIGEAKRRCMFVKLRCLFRYANEERDVAENGTTRLSAEEKLKRDSCRLCGGSGWRPVTVKAPHPFDPSRTTDRTHVVPCDHGVVAADRKSESAGE